MILFLPTGITNIPDGANFRFLRDVFIHFLEKNMTVNNPNCEILCNSIIFPSTRPDEVERLYARCFEQASAWVQLQRGTTKMRKLLPKLRVAVYSSVIRTSRQLDDLCDRIAAVMDVLCSTVPDCDRMKFKRVYLSSTDIFISDPLVANTRPWAGKGCANSSLRRARIE